MSTSMSWMALFFEDKGLPRRACMASGGRKCSWGEGTQAAPGERGPEAREGQVLWPRQRHSREGRSWRELSRRGKNLPAGVGRDKIQPSLKVILPDTCASTSLLPPTESPFASGMKSNSITWNQGNTLPTTTGITIRWAPVREVQNPWL